MKAVRSGPHRNLTKTLVAVAGLAMAVLGVRGATTPLVSDRAAVIVQAQDMTTAAAAVRQAGGEITHELGIIDSVGALLPIRDSTSRATWRAPALRGTRRSGLDREVLPPGSEW